MHQIACLNNEVDDLASLGCCVEIWVDLVRRIVVTDSFAVALKILVNGSSVEEHVWVGLLHLLFSLQVRPQRQVELLYVLIVREEVGEVRIAKHVYSTEKQ